MNVKASVLYLSYDGLTDPLGQSQILPYLCGLAGRDYSIHIISFEKKQRLESSGDKIRLLCKQYSIQWSPLIYHKSPPVLSTLLDLFHLFRLSRKISRDKEADIVHCRSYITSLVGLYLKRKYKVKFVFDMRGFWADERVEGGLWNLKNPLFRRIFNFFKQKEKQFLSEADHIVSLTETAKQEIKSWRLGVNEISVIPTCVDMDLFNPARLDEKEIKEVRRTLGINEENFVLLYVGSWGTWYLTDDVLNLFTRIKERISNAKFLILSPDHPDIKSHPYASDIIIYSASRDKVPVFISLSHLTVCFVKPSFSKKASSATKMAEAWAMNRQVVTNEGWGDIHLLEKKFPGLISVIREQVDYDELIKKWVLNKGDLDLRKELLGNFDLKSGIDKYEAIYSVLSR
jgi:glycosyltransferase involved in cell wall biosynthesis